MFGQSSLASPDYDIALIAKELEQLTSNETSLGPEQICPPGVSTVEKAKKWFWAVLVGTVVSQITLIVRMVRKSPTSA